jgi:hypothetical protein
MVDDLCSIFNSGTHGCIQYRIAREFEYASCMSGADDRFERIDRAEAPGNQVALLQLPSLPSCQALPIGICIDLHSCIHASQHTHASTGCVPAHPIYRDASRNQCVDERVAQPGRPGFSRAGKRMRSFPQTSSTRRGSTPTLDMY